MTAVQFQAQFGYLLSFDIGKQDDIYRFTIRDTAPFNYVTKKKVEVDLSKMSFKYSPPTSSVRLLRRQENQKSWK